QAGATGKLIDNVRAERIRHLPRRDILVLSPVDPTVDDVAEALLLELLNQAAESIESVAGRGVGGVRLRILRPRCWAGGWRLVGALPTEIARGEQCQKRDDQRFGDVAAGNGGAAVRTKNVASHTDLLNNGYIRPRNVNLAPWVPLTKQGFAAVHV